VGEPGAAGVGISLMNPDAVEEVWQRLLRRLKLPFHEPFAVKRAKGVEVGALLRVVHHPDSVSALSRVRHHRAASRSSRMPSASGCNTRR
jgi:hypothetical protein